MPTLRLGDRERAEIRSGFARVANRASNNKQFPLTEEDITEFGYSMLEPRIAKYYEFLRDEASDLTSAATWNPEFKVRGKEHVYEITLHGVTLPKEGLLLTDDHAMYRPILVWAREQWDVELRIARAIGYLHEIVEKCSSTGQIKRVLQDEIIRFVPEYMQETFGYAERQSRVPAGLNIDKEKLNELANVLALGSISPDDREGIGTTVNRHDI